MESIGRPKMNKLSTIYRGKGPAVFGRFAPASAQKGGARQRAHLMHIQRSSLPRARWRGEMASRPDGCDGYGRDSGAIISHHLIYFIPFQCGKKTTFPFSASTILVRKTQSASIFFPFLCVLSMSVYQFLPISVPIPCPFPSSTLAFCFPFHLLFDLHIPQCTSIIRGIIAVLCF